MTANPLINLVGPVRPSWYYQVILDKLSSACAEASESKDYIDSVVAAKKTPNFLGSDEFKALFLEQYKANASLFQEIGIKKQ